MVEATTSTGRQAFSIEHQQNGGGVPSPRTALQANSIRGGVAAAAATTTSASSSSVKGNPKAGRNDKNSRIVMCVLIFCVCLVLFLFIMQMSLMGATFQQRHAPQTQEEREAEQMRALEELFDSGEGPTMNGRKVKVVIRFNGGGGAKLRGAGHALDGLDDGLRQLLEGSANRISGSLLPHVHEVHGKEDHKEIKHNEGGGQIIRVTRRMSNPFVSAGNPFDMFGGGEDPFGDPFAATEDPIEAMMQAALGEAIGMGGGGPPGHQMVMHSGNHDNHAVRVVRLGNPQEAMDSLFPMMMLSTLMESGILSHIMKDLSSKYGNAPKEFKDPVTDALLDEPGYIYWPKKDTLWKERAFEIHQIKHWFKIGKTTNPANDAEMPGRFDVEPAPELKKRIQEWKAEQDAEEAKKRQDPHAAKNVDEGLAYDDKGNLVPEVKNARGQAEAMTAEAVHSEEIHLWQESKCALTQKRLLELASPVTRDGVNFYEATALDEFLRHNPKDPATQVVAVRSEYIGAKDLIAEFGKSAPHGKATPMDAARALHLAGQRFNEKTLTYNAFKARAVRIFTNGHASWEPAKGKKKRVLVLSAEEDDGAQHMLKEQFLRKGFEEVDVKNFKTPEEFQAHQNFAAEGYDEMYDLGVLPKAHRKSTESIAGFWSKIKSLFSNDSAQFTTMSAMDAEDLEAAHKLACKEGKEKDCRALQILSVQNVNGVTQTRWVPKPKHTEF